MTRYEIIVEELQNRVDSGEISIEFAESVNDIAYEKYVCEGTNSDIIKKYNTKIDEYKEEKKKINSYIKKGDRDNLKKSLNNAEKILNDTKKEISAIDSSVFDNMSAQILTPLNNVLTTNLYGDTVAGIDSVFTLMKLFGAGAAAAYAFKKDTQRVNDDGTINPDDEIAKQIKKKRDSLAIKISAVAIGGLLAGAMSSIQHKMSKGREGGNNLKDKCIKSINMEIEHIHYMQNKFDL